MVEGCVTSGLIFSVVANNPTVMLALRCDFIGLCINNLSWRRQGLDALSPFLCISRQTIESTNSLYPLIGRHNDGLE